jgi:SulP family sulfate permease
MSWVSRVLPDWLTGYQKAFLGADVLAAVALLVIGVPEQLATSRLAQMPPVTGLYAFVAGSVLFALLGSNRQLSMGADSTIAPLFAAGIGHLAPGGSADYAALVGILAVVVGGLVAAVGLLRLGWIAEFLSAPIITGFLAGVAVIIIVHQLPDLLGLPSVSGSTIHRLTTIARHLGSTNGWTIAIGAGVFLLVVGAERLDPRAPAALAGLAGSTVLVWAAHLRAHGVAVLGAVAHHPPHVGLTGLSWTTLGSVFPIAGVVALVVVSQTAATSRAFADAGGFDIDINRDFVGAGAGSVAAGLFGSFPVDASPGRTSAVARAGGKTQVVGLLVAAAVVVLVPAAGILTDVPDAALAGVLVYIAVRIFHTRELTAVFRFDLFEFGLALSTLLIVALVGVEQGIGAAVGLAILDRTRLGSRPTLHVLEKIEGTTSWRPVEQGEKPTATTDGVLVLLYAAPLYYATADRFRSQLDALVKEHEGPVHAIVLDVVGMHDLDFTGAKAVRAFLERMKKQHVTFALARAGHHLRQNLERSGLDELIGKDHFYDSVDIAVSSLSAST